MIVRKTLQQIKADGGGRFDKEKFVGFTDADIERMIDEDADLAPRTETLVPYLAARDVRRKLGLTQQKFAAKLGVSWRPSEAGSAVSRRRTQSSRRFCASSTASPNPGNNGCRICRPSGMLGAWRSGCACGSGELR